MKARGEPRRDRRIREHLDADEPLYASATFNTGSVAKAALRGGVAPIVRLAVTDRRFIMFATSDLALNLKLGDLLRSVPFSDIECVQASKVRPLGVSGLRLHVSLSDKSELAFEASGFTVASARRLVPIFEEAVASYRKRAGQ